MRLGTVLGTVTGVLKNGWNEEETRRRVGTGRVELARSRRSPSSAGFGRGGEGGEEREERGQGRGPGGRGEGREPSEEEQPRVPSGFDGARPTAHGEKGSSRFQRNRKIQGKSQGSLPKLVAKTSGIGTGFTLTNPSPRRGAHCHGGLESSPCSTHILPSEAVVADECRPATTRALRCCRASESASQRRRGVLFTRSFRASCQERLRVEASQGSSGIGRIRGPKRPGRTRSRESSKSAKAWNASTRSEYRDAPLRSAPRRAGRSTSNHLGTPRTQFVFSVRGVLPAPGALLQSRRGDCHGDDAVGCGVSAGPGFGSPV